MRAQFDGHVSSGSDGDSTGSALAAPLSEMGKQSAPEPHLAQEKTIKNYRKMPSYLGQPYHPAAQNRLPTEAKQG